MRIGQLTGLEEIPDGKVTVEGATIRCCTVCEKSYPVCSYDKKTRSYECSGRHKNHLRDLYFKAIGELVHVPDLCKRCYRQGYAMLKADRDQYLLWKAELDEMRREARVKARREHTRKKRKTTSEAAALNYEASLVAEELKARAVADTKFKRIIKGKKIKGAEFTEKELKDLEREMLAS